MACLEYFSLTVKYTKGLLYYISSELVWGLNSSDGSMNPLNSWNSRDTKSLNWP